MAKVVQRVINHNYTAIKPDILVKGGSVPFDTYIKRYNDFVIIVEAGTLLNDDLYSKIQQNDVIYFQNHDSDKVKSYCTMYKQIYQVDASVHPQRQDPLASALKLKEKVSYITDLERRLSTVYSVTSELMQYIFVSMNEKLPRDALYMCVSEIVTVVNSSSAILPILLKMMPDEYTTHHHSTNVAFFAAILGDMLHLTHEELMDLTYGGIMHDIGKIRIDQKILEKPSSLEDEEFDLVKQHSEVGYVILENNGIVNQNILKGVLYHHERLDGSGYPHHLKGKQIPKMARILGICDVFDALTTKRTFRKSYTSFEALLVMKKEMHSQLDETFIDLFVRLHR